MAPLNPEVRLERFLAGQNLTPAVRLEYFLAGAAGYGLAALQNESAAISAGGTAVATIPDAADNVPLQSLVVAVDLLREGTGTPAPDNVMPILEQDSATVTLADAFDENPVDYTAKLPAGFYGGTVDVAKGEALSKYGCVYGRDVEWTFLDAYHVAYAFLPGKLEGYANYLCSEYTTVTKFYQALLNGETSGVTNNNGVNVCNTSWTSVDDVVADMADVQFVYELKTPVEIDIDPVTILTFHGVNNISADTGNVLAVEYKQDPEASANEIKAIIAPVLPEMKADENLVTNDFRIVGNTLYQITANVASGGTLTPGSNCTATTVAAQLKALLNA